MKKPDSNEFLQGTLFAAYSTLVQTENVIDLLHSQLSTVLSLYGTLSPDQEMYRYAEGKWSPKEILGHLTDAERIFAYRALCIARGETQPLLSFDEKVYVDNANFDDQPLADLLEQYRYVRLSTIALAQSLSIEAQMRIGMVNKYPISSRAFFRIIGGHEQHHLIILNERYHIS